MRGIDEVGRGAGGIALEPQSQSGVAPARIARDWSTFWRRLRTRRPLLNMSDEDLADVGLTRAQAEREARMPFWKMLP
ncbi:conserved hypothetical protein [Pseudomonas sp. 8Z]|uniref:DUF1127 domain-containing protein n=1 Tax=Pseudomonas sp. 8Z TaxID=2653166 RepID=UPI0012F35D8F|nr:DUF1127 domain-containing protein [Pseudomonas sp. 8Z]VXC46930.1 conserved hypothetical protein [Pseudomonas sp. 8Z]